jgi:hypothetical protein
MRNFDEKKLVSKLDKILKKEFGTNLSFHEFSAGYGIADLVFAANFSFSKRAMRRVPLTNFSTLNVFLNLDEYKTYSFTDVVAIFPHLREAEIKKQINFLIKNGYLKKISGNKFKKNIGSKSLSPIKKIIAIEVKLSDHKGGLIQARRYQYFADESYLAILKEAQKNINVDEFNLHNIGLILFDSKTNTIEIKYPKSNNSICNNSVSLFAKEMMTNQYLIS